MSLRNLCKFGLACAIILTVPTLRAADATLLKKTGSVTMTPKGGQPTELNVNDKIPDGATVKTGPGAEAYLQPIDGAVATMKANTTLEIGTGNATINLKSGNLVSTIDPAKKANYSVRTPKGVASARGTAFSTVVDGVNVTIASTADAVTFTIGNQIMTISAGQVSYTPPGATQPSAPVPLAQAAASNPAIMQMVQTAVQTMASVVQNNVGNMSAASATTLATQVVAVASAAAPEQAATFTSQVVTAMTSPTASTATSAATTTTAIASVAAAAAQAAPGQAAQVASAAVQAAPAQTGVVTSAVSQAVPSASTAVVNSVAQTTGQSTASVQTQSDAAQSQGAAVVSSVTTTNNAIVTQTTTGQQQQVQPPPQQQQQQQTTPQVDPTVKSASTSH